MLIVFDDMVAHMLSNKRLNPRVTELFIRGGKLSIYLFLLHNLFLLYQRIIQTAFYTLFYYENSKQIANRTSTNCI